VMHRPDLRASSQPISVVIGRELNCNSKRLPLFFVQTMSGHAMQNLIQYPYPD